jgi:hypothetical protein
VPVAGVREVESANQGLIALDEAISNRAVHPLAKDRGLLLGDARAGLNQRPGHLIEDLVGPLGLDEVRQLGDPDQQVAQRVRVEHVRVVYDDEGGHG